MRILSRILFSKSKAKNSIPYTVGQVLFSSSQDGATATVEVLCDGIYNLKLVGGGSGGFYRMSMAQMSYYFQQCGGGGGGAAFVGDIYLTAGTYNVTVGSAGPNCNVKGTNSVFGNCIAYATSDDTNVNAATGGNAPTIPYQIISSTVNSAGNNGTGNGAAGMPTTLTGTGGASLYGGYGKGASLSNSTTTSPATSGFVELSFVGT